MPDITTEIAKLVSREAELSQLVPDLEKEALAHEAAAREARLKRSVAKDELGAIRKALTDARVVQMTQSAAADAQRAKAEAEKSKADAEETLRRLAKKERAQDAKMAELDALLAKASEATKEKPEDRAEV